jgi:hypothetical protein
MEFPFIFNGYSISDKWNFHLFFGCTDTLLTISPNDQVGQSYLTGPPIRGPILCIFENAVETKMVDHRHKKEEERKSGRQRHHQSSTTVTVVAVESTVHTETYRIVSYTTVVFQSLII